MHQILDESAETPSPWHLIPKATGKMVRTLWYLPSSFVSSVSRKASDECGIVILATGLIRVS